MRAPWGGSHIPQTPDPKESLPRALLAEGGLMEERGGGARGCEHGGSGGKRGGLQRSWEDGGQGQHPAHPWWGTYCPSGTAAAAHWARNAMSHLSPRHPHTLNLSWKWKSISRVRLFVTPYTVHGILQAKILEWVAFPFARGSFQSRDWTQVSCIAGGFFTSWVTTGLFPTLLGCHQPLPRVGPGRPARRSLAGSGWGVSCSSLCFGWTTWLLTSRDGSFQAWKKQHKPTCPLRTSTFWEISVRLVSCSGLRLSHLWAIHSSPCYRRASPWGSTVLGQPRHPSKSPAQSQGENSILHNGHWQLTLESPLVVWALVQALCVGWLNSKG